MTASDSGNQGAGQRADTNAAGTVGHSVFESVSAGPPVLQVAQQLDDGACAGVPAAFLGDQAKAFEYLGHPWLRTVLRYWLLPYWANGFLLGP